MTHEIAQYNNNNNNKAQHLFARIEMFFTFHSYITYATTLHHHVSMPTYHVGVTSEASVFIVAASNYCSL